MKYPISVQDFEKLITGKYVYVDKTDLVYELAQLNVCFLSRPRRFGKSLLISTLEAYFTGKKDLFKGLKIDEKKVRLYFNLYMRVQFGITSYLRDELQSSKVITGGLSMNLLDTEDYYVEVIVASTEYPDYFIKRVKETFDERNINEEDVIRKVNASVSNLIMYFDDIEVVNSQIQDDVIDFGEYMYNIYDVYKSLNIEDAREVVKRLNKHITTETIIKPLEEK